MNIRELNSASFTQNEPRGRSSVWKPFVASLSLLLAPGCVTSVNTVEPAQPTYQKQMVADKRMISDPSLNRKVSIIGLNEGVTPGGLRQIQVEVFNATRSIQRFNYRVQWFDAAGMEVSTPLSSGMTPMSIEGRETKFIRAVAPNPNVVDFKVQFVENH